MRSLNLALCATAASLLLLGCASTASLPDKTQEEREKQAEESRAVLERIQRSGPGPIKTN